MDDKLLGVFSTLGGLVVGWTLNELSYLFKNNRENKRILNQVLFTQLEIRNILIKTNLTEVEKQLTAVYLKRFPKENIDDLNQTIGKLFYGFIQNELNNKFSIKITSLSEEYSNYITKLSQIDPFITYSISNKEVILDYLGYIDKYLASIENYLNEQVLIDEPELVEDKSKRTFKMHFDEIAKQITPLLRKTAIETIEVDIKNISKKINFITYIKTSRFLISVNRQHNVYQ
jgi:hypothetical protein